MRGYFAIGAEGISKPMNLGNLLRTAHAFGASYFFTLAPGMALRQARLADTSDASKHLPLYSHDTVADLKLPKGCRLIGVELDAAAVELPSFHHPTAAAYVFGPERGELSRDLRARCDRMVTIPTKFAVNIGIAGAIVMYDRLISRGRFARRPLNPRAAAEALPQHVRGAQIVRSRRAKDAGR